jgi:CHAT domain-containing protein
VPLGDAVTIDELVAGVRAQVRRELGAGGVGAQRNERLYRDAGAALRRRIWDPLESHLGAGVRTLIVPEGPLGLINFSALPVSTSQYLVDRRVIHTMTAERDLVASSRPVTSATNGILAVGNPAFDAGQMFASLAPDREPVAAAPAARASQHRGPQQACAAFGDVRFNPLPASLRETQDLARLWSTLAERGRVASLNGPDATETAVKSQAPGHRVVHLATHGFFLNESCDRPAAPVGDPTLLFGGLAFAGANRRAAVSGDEDDGILTSEEVAALDLSGAEWAVLSGCDTGLGVAHTGEGVLGFRRAFQIAGARTTIMSLWPVDDGATRTWMSDLYAAHYRDGRSTADAVRQATRNALTTRRSRNVSTHPFYWAGFVATGDWR